MAVDWKFLFLSYEGRINRALWWLGLICTVLLSGLGVIVFGHDSVLAWLWNLILLYPSLCIYIKRCHDRDQSGWWVLLLLVPVVGFLWALINLGIMQGTRGPNRFGPDPLGRVI
ncbi:uncharacterized membrane protein YhaH (DUF805 family) [Rhodoligotrophos appendicifer]|uniref:DUF805 domain-containing protein n=1 Tax=Rhodoligotrophos appendicifer TaxID=987056 RepID=UPI00118693C5|nr:DUF805 domain-containing protein [Rhodoligotrophos appendicifer]